VINMGVGESVGEPKALENAVSEMTAIAGQKPALRRAKKAISNFKLREGVAVGCMVTLRGNRMYEFLDRLITLALPQVRDFRGVPAKGFDGRGNYNLGIKEQIIFPEIDYDRIDHIRGMNITIVTSAQTDEEGRELLKSFGMPFGN
jgi:large subunit ribosomal protein L5